MLAVCVCLQLACLFRLTRSGNPAIRAKYEHQIRTPIEIHWHAYLLGVNKLSYIGVRSHAHCPCHAWLSAHNSIWIWTPRNRIIRYHWDAHNSIFTSILSATSDWPCVVVNQCIQYTFNNRTIHAIMDFPEFLVRWKSVATWHQRIWFEGIARFSSIK